jgi:hypothetical protein
MNFFAAFMIFVSVVSGCLFCGDSDDLLRKFLDTYGTDSAKFEEAYEEGLSINATVRLAEDKQSTDMKVFFLGSMCRVESDYESAKKISCKSREWTFAVAQRNGRYELLHIDRNDSDDIDDPELDMAQILFHPHSYVYGYPLLDVVRSRNFKVLGSRTTKLSGDDLIEISYEWTRGERLSRELVVLNPKNDWAICQHQMQTVSGKPIVSEVKYSIDSRKPSELRVMLAGKPFRHVMFSDWSPASLDEQPFYPSYYGLPEYSNSRRVWMYVIAGFLLCFVIILVAWNKNSNRR